MTQSSVLCSIASRKKFFFFFLLQCVRVKLDNILTFFVTQKKIFSLSILGVVCYFPKKKSQIFLLVKDFSNFQVPLIKLPSYYFILFFKLFSCPLLPFVAKKNKQIDISGLQTKKINTPISINKYLYVYQILSNIDCFIVFLISKCMLLSIAYLGHTNKEKQHSNLNNDTTFFPLFYYVIHKLVAFCVILIFTSTLLLLLLLLLRSQITLFSKTIYFNNQSLLFKKISFFYYFLFGCSKHECTSLISYYSIVKIFFF